MVHSSDIEYQETKLIKLGQKQIEQRFKALADWISAYYDVKVLNIFFDVMSHNGQPRVSIILEFYDDAMKFHVDDNWWSAFDSMKEKEIAEKYMELVKDPDAKRAGEIFVCFSAFEPIALEEVNGMIPEERISELQDKLNVPELWTISRCMNVCFFFVYTDKQAKAIRGSEIHQRFVDEYFLLLKEYDEFGYWSKDGFNVGIDSKENFDMNYESNWHYFYK